MSFVVVLGLTVAACGKDDGAAPRPVRSLAHSQVQTVTLAAVPPKPDRAGLRREREITAMLNRASRAVARDKRCRLPRPPRRATFTDAAPSAALLDTFAILRRPQTEAERIPDERTFLLVGNVHRGAYRIAISAAGTRHLIAVAESAGRTTPRPPECADRFRAHFEADLTGHGPAFTREARAALRRIVRDEWTPAPGAGEPREVLYLFDYRHGGPGGGGGGATLDFVRNGGMLGSRSVGASSSIVSALIPDGVTTVEMTFARTASRGRYRPPRRYPSAVTRTAPVADNVISLRVPRPAADAFPARTVWKGPDGQIVRVIPGRD